MPDNEQAKAHIDTGLYFGEAKITKVPFETQDDPTGRKWTWQEGEYTVYRTNARTGPGCHDNCGLLLYVKDGVLVKLEGDKENPYNQGRLCPRCLALNDVLYHPDRILHPMKRVGKRGENKWENISWEDAYDLIEGELRKVIDQYGPEAIWVTKGTGRDTNGYLHRLAESIGTPNNSMSFFSGTACYGPRIASTGLKFGDFFVSDYSQFFPDRWDDARFVNPECIVIWGNNPLVANSDGTLGYWIVECMKRGSELVVVDPKLTWMASRAKWWLQIRPGTDCALAMAMADVMCQEGIYDKEFVEKWSEGFEAFREHVHEMPPSGRPRSAASMRTT